MNDEERGFLEVFSEEFRELKARVDALEERLAEQPSLEEIRAILCQLTDTAIPQLNNSVKDLKAESKKTQDKLAKLQSVPSDIAVIDVRLDALEADAIEPEAAAAKVLPKFRKIDTKKEMDAEFAKHDRDVLAEVAKLLEPSSEKDRAVVRLMIESSTRNGKGDGELTAEIITLFGTKAHAKAAAGV